LAGNQHDPAIVEHDAVAVAQRHGLVEVHQEFCSAFTLQHDAAAMPVARIEHDESRPRRLDSRSQRGEQPSRASRLPAERT
jgi:hypothetical protein